MLGRSVRTVQEHSDHMVKRWKEEIDMFLVFAGLFSAVLTAFNVQSYALLQQDNSDTTARALIQISAQLRSMTLSETSINSTAPEFVLEPYTVPRYAVWTNALWFSSLICTLSASSVAIMVKQWLQQYSQGLSGNSHEIARLRQYRYESLLKWRVVGIIAMLPILLQLALVLFLAGLITLLWSLHPVVAGIASLMVGILLAFTSATSILPAFKPDCFYQSPQALGIFLILQAIRRAVTFSKKANYFRNWHLREKEEVRARRADLDRGLAAKTYRITLDETVLKAAVVPCMWDLPPERLTPFLEDILRTSNRWEPVVPCILHFMTLAARSPETNKAMVRKLLAEAWWPRMEANSEIGQLFVRTMATLVSRRLEPRYAFYRVTQTLAYSALDGGIRIDTDLVELLVSILPSPQTSKDFAVLIRTRDPKNIPLVFSYFQVLPQLVRYLARLVPNSPHDKERVQLQIDTVFDTLQAFLMYVALTEDLSNLGIILWALRSSTHIAQMVSLKTDAICSPLVPSDIVESYQDVLKSIGAAATTKTFQMYFKRHLDKLPCATLGGRDALKLISTLQDDLDVLAKLHWMLPWQNTSRRRRTANGSTASATSPPFSPRLYAPQRPALISPSPSSDSAATAVESMTLASPKLVAPGSARTQPSTPPSAWPGDASPSPRADADSSRSSVVHDAAEAEQGPLPTQNNFPPGTRTPPATHDSEDRDAPSRPTRSTPRGRARTLIRLNGSAPDDPIRIQLPTLEPIAVPSPSSFADPALPILLQPPDTDAEAAASDTEESPLFRDRGRRSSISRMV
ncbi:hypothetical protein C8Q76DRAFT_475776 [Earliella scabrosa]|nr:hypothetical protein C8Q76DRAFT_475776 [Earliella scabrosa]